MLMAARSGDTRTDLWWWVRWALLIVSRAYRGFLLVLCAVSLAPLAFGWGSYIVRSGSMEPSVKVGDIVIAKPLAQDESPTVGRVMVFTNPARTDGELLVHRIVSRNDDGTYTSAGDANAFSDSTPVTRDDVKARAVLLAPYAGLPLVWWDQHNFVALGIWLWATVAAFVLAADPDRKKRKKGRGGPSGGRRQEPAQQRVRAFQPTASRPLVPLRGVRLAMLGRSVSPQHRRTTRRTTRRSRVVPVVAALLAGGTLLTAGNVASATYTSRTVNGSNTWTVGTWRSTGPYVSAVMADSPSLFYLLDEPNGTWASDYSGNDQTGRYTDIASYRVPGATPDDFGYGVALDKTSRIIPDGTAVASPLNFTLELWFKTRTTAGGPLLGFEATRDESSFPADRQVKMDAAGHIVYGGWTSVSSKPLTSTARYNDGAWHHLAVSVTGSGLTENASVYVDGAKVASGPTSWVSIFTGWWRIGAGTVPGTFGLPSAAGFTGSVDDVAVYPTALSAARISAHYAAR